MHKQILKMYQKQAVDDLMLHKEAVLDLLPSDMEEVTRLDAGYHANEKDNWIKQNQVDTYRNSHYHHQIVQEVCSTLNFQSVILELGGGVGFDADLLIREGCLFKCYILSEISPLLLEYAKMTNSSFTNQPVMFCALDASDLLIADRQIDVVFMIAALHHFPDLHKAISEIDRVTKDKASIIFGIEPNSMWSQLLARMRPLYRKLFVKRDHSAADEEAEGFSRKDFYNIASQVGWKIEKITPVWFFTAFMHYGLEFLFRLLRLKQRIRIPQFVEKLIVSLDKLFFRIPYAQNLAWHYTVVIRKDSKPNPSIGF